MQTEDAKILSEVLSEIKEQNRKEDQQWKKEQKIRATGRERQRQINDAKILAAEINDSSSIGSESPIVAARWAREGEKGAKATAENTLTITDQLDAQRALMIEHHGRSSKFSQLLNNLQVIQMFKRGIAEKEAMKAGKDSKHMANQNYVLLDVLTQELVSLHSTIIGENKATALARQKGAKNKQHTGLSRESGIDESFDYAVKDNKLTKGIGWIPFLDLKYSIIQNRSDLYAQIQETDDALDSSYISGIRFFKKRKLKKLRAVEDEMKQLGKRSGLGSRAKQTSLGLSDETTPFLTNTLSPEDAKYLANSNETIAAGKQAEAEIMLDGVGFGKADPELLSIVSAGKDAQDVLVHAFGRNTKAQQEGIQSFKDLIKSQEEGLAEYIIELGPGGSKPISGTVDTGPGGDCCDTMRKTLLIAQRTEKRDIVRLKLNRLADGRDRLRRREEIEARRDSMNEGGKMSKQAAARRASRMSKAGKDEDSGILGAVAAGVTGVVGTAATIKTASTVKKILTKKPPITETPPKMSKAPPSSWIKTKMKAWLKGLSPKELKKYISYAKTAKNVSKLKAALLGAPGLGWIALALTVVAEEIVIGYFIEAVEEVIAERDKEAKAAAKAPAPQPPITKIVSKPPVSAVLTSKQEYQQGLAGLNQFMHGIVNKETSGGFMGFNPVRSMAHGQVSDIMGRFNNPDKVTSGMLSNTRGLIADKAGSMLGPQKTKYILERFDQFVTQFEKYKDATNVNQNDALEKTFLEKALHPGSIYTNDIHTTERLDKMLAIMGGGDDYDDDPDTRGFFGNKPRKPRTKAEQEKIKKQIQKSKELLDPDGSKGINNAKNIALLGASISPLSKGTGLEKWFQKGFNPAEMSMTPRQLLNNDVMQMSKSNAAFGKYGQGMQGWRPHNVFGAFGPQQISTGPTPAVRAAGRFGARLLPGVGAGLAGADAFNRFTSGDNLGGALSVGSAVPLAGLVPLAVQVLTDYLDITGPGRNPSRNSMMNDLSPRGSNGSGGSAAPVIINTNNSSVSNGSTAIVMPTTAHAPGSPAGLNAL